MENYIVFDTVLGKIIISADENAITGLHFEKELPRFTGTAQETPLLREAKTQLLDYLDGKRKDFDLPLAPKGTEFQRKVWDALRQIPYGKTRTYGQIAANCGNPKACRAVGMANNRNPIAIFIPCHRVIGANGKLVGYGGGLDIKEALLQREQK